ncbi:MAG: COX15/CtaA family protein [Bdellovibrionota bacterium]|nr:COX15/CtaA family protein [Bdellovibrionota bacterium]
MSVNSNLNIDSKYNVTLKICVATIFILIALGGIVRATGSGMGCPDWPKCFGQYIPPTDISQLPEDYKSKFAVAGRKVADFDVFKTWVEYINRLFGVWTGFAVLALSFFSLKYRKSHPHIFYYSQASLILVILNGWLGSKVVSTHLSPGVITAHMLLAVFLVFVLYKLKKYTSLIPRNDNTFHDLKKYRNLGLFIVGLVVVQIILGTQVREQIDYITNTEPNLSRSNWVDRLDWVFYVHRSFSIVLILVLFKFFKELRENFSDDQYVQNSIMQIALCLFAEIAAGVSLSYFSFPALAAPIHLLFAIVMIAKVYDLYEYFSPVDLK